MKLVIVALLAMAGMAPADEGKKEEGATVTGVVHIKPRVRVLNLPLAPDCAQLCGGVASKSEENVVDANNNVKWAFVWIKKGLEGKVFPVPTEPLLLDQEGCTYKPHVFGIRVGQTLNIRNSDPTAHNVHGLPFDNKEFNFAQPVKGQVNPVVFTKPEVMVMVRCEIHKAMLTWAGVLDHPFFAVTDDAGKFTIKGLPAGKYTVAFWQERWTIEKESDRIQEIDVKAGETKTVNFDLDKKKE